MDGGVFQDRARVIEMEQPAGLPTDMAVSSRRRLVQSPWPTKLQLLVVFLKLVAKKKKNLLPANM